MTETKQNGTRNKQDEHKLKKQNQNIFLIGLKQRKTQI